MNPIASIIIPVYNREKLIAEALESACNQTLGDIEIIVGDNCSTDNTYEVCQAYAARDPRIVLFRNESNVGPVLNWMACLARARAPYLKFLFSDDLLHPRSLEKLLPGLLASECAFSFSPVIIGQEPWKGSVFYEYAMTDTRLGINQFASLSFKWFGALPVSPGAALFRTADVRKNLLRNLPGVTDYDFLATGAGVDWLIYLLTLTQYRYVQFCAEPMSFFRAHPDSLTVRNEDNKVMVGYQKAQQWFMARNVATA
jgi:glycosyltransferase involved in cell wall biosynthesis